MKAVYEALRETKWSNDRLARAVVERWKQLEPERKGMPGYRSVAGEIGTLKRGADATWWRNRPLALRALATVLGIPERALADESAAGASAFPFRRCPALPSLLRGESPCPTDVAGTWLGAQVHEALRRRGKTWFSVPHGGGKRLACYWVRNLRTDAVVLEVDSLQDLDLSALREDQHILIRVEHASARASEDDIAVLRRLSRRHEASVCVLAPFDVPEVYATLGLGWSPGRWELADGWRHTLIGWFIARAGTGETPSAEAVFRWLENVDPAEELFSTPGDLLMVLDRLHRLGLPDARVSRLDLGVECATRLLKGHSDPFLVHCGVHVSRDMLRRRFADRASVARALSRDEWLRYCDVPAPDNAVAPARRRAKAEPAVASVTTKTEPRLVIRALHDEGILRTTTSGLLEFAPWLRLPVVCECVAHAIKRRDPTWALWATDTTRHDAVGDALDSLSVGACLDAATLALDSDFGVLSDAATLEAVFDAIARRFANLPRRFDHGLRAKLQRLGVAQLRLVRTMGLSHCIGPVTLPRDPVLQKEWLNNAWTFSFEVPRPDDLEELDFSPGLVLPGWADTLDLELDAPVLSLLWNLDEPMRDLTRVLQKLGDVRLPNLIPLDLVVGFILDERLRPRLRASHWHMFFTSSDDVAAASLCDRFAEVSEAGKQAVLEATFDAAREHFRDGLARMIHLDERLLRGWCHAVGDDRWEALVGGDTMMGAFKMLHFATLATDSDVTRKLADVVFRRFARLPREERRLHSFDHLERVFEVLEQDAVPCLVELVEDHAGPGQLAAARVWQLDAERALVAAKDALAQGSLAASPWFHMAPQECLSELIEFLEGWPHVYPQWVDGWVRAQLPHAGASGERAYRLLLRAR